MIIGKVRLPQIVTDQYTKYKWPTVFCAVPRVGDLVEGSREDAEMQFIFLVVTQVVHSARQTYEKVMQRTSMSPFIEVVLKEIPKEIKK